MVRVDDSLSLSRSGGRERHKNGARYFRMDQDFRRQPTSPGYVGQVVNLRPIVNRRSRPHRWLPGKAGTPGAVRGTVGQLFFRTGAGTGSTTPGLERTGGPYR